MDRHPKRVPQDRLAERLLRRREAIVAPCRARTLIWVMAAGAVLGCSDTTAPALLPEPRILDVIATALEPAQAPPGFPVMDEFGCGNDGSVDLCNVLLRYVTNRPRTTVHLTNYYWNYAIPTGDDGRDEFIVQYPRGGSSRVLLCVAPCESSDDEPRSDIWSVTLSGPPLNVVTVRP